MNDPFILVGLFLGLLALIAYVIRGEGRLHDLNLADAISLLLSGIGLLTGITVCWFAYVYREVLPLKDISTQTFIGGVAIVWVATANAIKKFRR